MRRTTFTASRCASPDRSPLPRSQALLGNALPRSSASSHRHPRRECRFCPVCRLEAELRDRAFPSGAWERDEPQDHNRPTRETHMGTTRQNRPRHRPGFTLIELLVVMSIIVFLAGILILLGPTLL